MLLVNQRTLYSLIVRNFIYVFVESMIFVVIVMYGYYVLLKRKEMHVMNLCFQFSGKKKLTIFFL